jgi:hypothetical protein
MAEEIRQHLTPYGQVTELVTSPHYERRLLARTDLGAVHRPGRGWPAPSRRHRAGRRDQPAIQGAVRGIRFDENVDALTGAGQRDRAYLDRQRLSDPRRGAAPTRAEL